MLQKSYEMSIGEHITVKVLDNQANNSSQAHTCMFDVSTT